MNTIIETPDGERHSVPVSVSLLISDLRQQITMLTKVNDLMQKELDATSPAETAPSRPFAAPKAQKSR